MFWWIRITKNRKSNLFCLKNINLLDQSHKCSVVFQFPGCSPMKVCESLVNPHKWPAYHFMLLRRYFYASGIKFRVFADAWRLAGCWRWLPWLFSAPLGVSNIFKSQHKAYAELNQQLVAISRLASNVFRSMMLSQHKKKMFSNIF